MYRRSEHEYNRQLCQASSLYLSFPSTGWLTSSKKWVLASTKYGIQLSSEVALPRAKLNRRFYNKFPWFAGQRWEFIKEKSKIFKLAFFLGRDLGLFLLFLNLTFFLGQKRVFLLSFLKSFYLYIYIPASGGRSGKIDKHL